MIIFYVYLNINPLKPHAMKTLILLSLFTILTSLLFAQKKDTAQCSIHDYKTEGQYIFDANTTIVQCDEN